MTQTPTLDRPASKGISRRNEPWIALGVVVTIVYSWLGLARWARGEAQSYDLGIFTQIAKDWSEGRLPAPPIKGASAFGDHFSPITVVFGLGYRIWPDSRSLIVVQSAAVAIAVALLASFASRRLGRPAVGAVVGLLAASSLPLVAPVVFETHEVALGAPIMVGLAIGVHEGKWRLTVVCSVLSFMVKEDLGLVVVAAGMAWWIARRETRRAVALIGLGAFATVLTQAVIIYAHPAHKSPYVRHLVEDQAAGGVLQPERLVPILIFLMVSGLTIRPVSLLAAPVLAWRVLSSNPLYWQVNLHYDVVIAPVAFVVLIDVLSGQEHGLTRTVYSPRSFISLLSACAVSLAGVAHTVSQRPWAVAPWQTDGAYVGLESLSARIPDNSRVVADNRLGPPLIPVHDVLMLSDNKPAEARWVLLDMSRDSQDAPLCSKTRWVSRQHTTQREGNLVLVDLGRPADVILPKC